MKQYEQMIEEMALELVKSKLRDIAQRRADEILKGLESGREASAEARAPLRAKTVHVPKWKVQAPKHSLLSLSMTAPALVGGEGTGTRAVWVHVHSILRGNQMVREQLSKRLCEITGKRYAIVSSLLTQFIQDGHLVVSAPKEKQS